MGQWWTNPNDKKEEDNTSNNWWVTPAPVEHKTIAPTIYNKPTTTLGMGDFKQAENNIQPLLPKLDSKKKGNSGFGKLSDVGKSLAHGSAKLGKFGFTTLDNININKTEGMNPYNVLNTELDKVEKNNKVDTSKMNFGGKAINFIADQTPSLAAYALLPETGLSAGITSKLAPLATSTVGKYGLNLAGKSLASGLEFGGLSGSVSAIEGNKPKQILNDTKSGFLGGAVFGGGSKVVGDSFKGISKLKTTETKPIVPFNKLLKTTEKPVDPINSITPKLPTAKGMKQNKFPNTLLKSDNTSPAFKENIKTADIKYNPITNKDTLIEAQRLIDNDRDYAHNMVLSAKTATPVTNATAQLLLKDMQNKGDYTAAINLLEKVSQQNTRAGQTIQSLAMWSRMTPDGMLRYAGKQFERANTKLPPNKQVKLDATLAEDITRKMKEIEKMPEGMDKNIATQRVLKNISDQIPASILKKIDTFQTMAQLLNPKTSIRNIIGNQVMIMAEDTKDLIGTPLDKLLSLKTGTRTTTIPSIPTQLKGYKEGFKQGFKEVKNDLPSDATQFDLPQGKVFSNNNPVGRTLNKGQKALDYMLKVPDNASKEAVRADSLRRQMKLAGVSKPTTDMLQRAENEARYATFQDDTLLSDAFSKGKQALNLNQDFGLGSMAIKYPRTPANLINRNLAFSPAGFLKAGGEVIKPLVKGGEFDQKAFVDSTARAITGTGAMGGAYELAKLGILTGKPDSDKDTNTMNNMAGMGAYKININALNRYVSSGFDPKEAKPQKGDKLINYDWLQPSAVGMAAGANMAQNKNKGGTLKRAYDAGVAGGNTVLNQPLVSGLTDYGNKLHDKGLIQGTLAVAGDIPSSMTPTFFKQIGQTIDNTTRNTYNASPVKQSLNKIQAKLPILSKELQPKYNTFGKPIKAFESNNLGNVFLNPANISTYNPSNEAKLPVGIYNETGDKTAMPRVTPNYFKNKGETIRLTEKENAELQKYVGEHTLQEYSNLVQSNSFMYINKEDQVKEIQKILNKINKEGKNMILEGRKKK